MDHSDNLEQC